MAPTIQHAAGLQTPAAASAPNVGAFMLTLCRLEAPVSIRPPQNPQLARFKFFTGRTRHTDGTERLYLHMGYFATVAEAERCAQLMRPRYPHVVVTPTPAAPRGLPAEPPVLHGIAPAEAGTLTDTQVLNILETRRIGLNGSAGHLADGQDRPDISLLRPDDTNTRRALKEAVVQGAVISFVLQLCRSAHPINLGSVAALDIFRAYTLYLAQGQHEGRPWYALRLGFFNDTVSAKQVAYYAHASFPSVAVVPINDVERQRASKEPIALTLLARRPAQRQEKSIDALLAADQAQSAVPEPPRYPSAEAPFKKPAAQGATRSQSAAGTNRQPRKDGLEQTLELLASSEIWSNSDTDSFSETGVRHLKVEVQKRSAKGS